MMSATNSLLVGLVIVLAFSETGFCISAEFKEKIMTTADSCISETGVSKDSVMKAINGDFSEEQNLKAFALCFAKKIGFLDEEGNPNVQAIREKLKMAVDDDAKVDAVAVRCMKSESTAEDTAINTFKCMLQIIKV